MIIHFFRTGFEVAFGSFEHCFRDHRSSAASNPVAESVFASVIPSRQNRSAGTMNWLADLTAKSSGCSL